MEDQSAAPQFLFDSRDLVTLCLCGFVFCIFLFFVLFFHLSYGYLQQNEADHVDCLVSWDAAGLFGAWRLS